MINPREVTPEQAREQVFYSYLSRRYQQPRNYRPFRYSHFQNALEWLANNNYKQDLRFLYAAARRLEHMQAGNHEDAHYYFRKGLKTFDEVWQEAQNRYLMQDCNDPSVLESFDFVGGAKWYDDSSVVSVFAINSIGECALVGRQKGYHDWTEDISKNTMDAIVYGIEEQFPRSSESYSA